MSRITAVLGPTNTGKTHYAIERMLAYRSGVIGLPLRLLAREVYDKIKARAGVENVALITGEEKIKPARALCPSFRYFRPYFRRFAASRGACKHNIGGVNVVGKVKLSPALRVGSAANPDGGKPARNARLQQ